MTDIKKAKEEFIKLYIWVGLSMTKEIIEQRLKEGNDLDLWNQVKEYANQEKEENPNTTIVNKYR